METETHLADRLSSANRIVRDYEKYIARQLKRGTSRQELNVSWMKKNELDLKRHVQELRDNIRSNWSTTGQELGKELRQFWPSSRPQSPARNIQNPLLTAAASSTSLNGSGSSHGDNHHLSPTSPSGSSMLGPRSPGAEGRAAVGNDFITGYTIGLIGGVRSWVSLISFLDTFLECYYLFAPHVVFLCLFEANK